MIVVSRQIDVLVGKGEKNILSLLLKPLLGCFVQIVLFRENILPVWKKIATQMYHRAVSYVKFLHRLLDIMQRHYGFPT